jgi:hypothetical protein
MPDPLLVSHKGKLVQLHADGRKVDYETGAPVKDEPDKPRPEAPKRWHDPYG